MPFGRLTSVSADIEQERLRALTSAAVALTSELDVDTLLQRIVDVARGLVDARYAALAVWEEGSIARFVYAGIDKDLARQIGSPPHGRGILGAVLREGRPIRLRNLPRDPRAVGAPSSHPAVTSFLGVPIGVRGVAYGDLYLANKIGAEEFSEDDESVAVNLASLAAAAIENARMFARERETAEQLRELDRMRADFVSIVSHELRNPLATIRSLAILLNDARSLVSDAERKEYLDSIVGETDRLTELVEDVLSESRIQSGSLSYLFVPYDPVRLVTRALEDARAASPGHTLDLDIPSSLPEVRGDAERMMQVLANLLSNACRYSSDGSTVTVRAGVRDGRLRVEVSDEGIGIAEEDVPRLFQRFVRLEHPGVAEIKGTGLGLYISRSIVEAHDGRISAESIPGKGSTFVIDVPVAGPAAESLH